jgi:hypothetical protein
MKSIFVLIAGCTLAVSVFAKLPALNDEAKAKAAEAAAKTAHVGKVENFLLCKSQDRTAAYYKKDKAVKGGADKSACVDPGAFVYTPAPAAPAVAVAPAAAPVVAAAPAAAVKK